MLFISCSQHGEVIQPVVIDMVGCSVCLVSSNIFRLMTTKYFELIKLYRELSNLIEVILFSLIKRLLDVLKQVLGM